MQQILILVLIITAIALIGLVMIQQGKGADIGAAFGSGASNTVFGSQGSGSFLLKITLAFALVFFVVCILLTRMAVHNEKQGSQLDLTSTSSASVLPHKNSVSNSVKKSSVSDSLVPNTQPKNPVTSKKSG